MVAMASFVYTYHKTYQIVHLKCVQFIIHQLYLRKKKVVKNEIK